MNDVTASVIWISLTFVAAGLVKGVVGMGLPTVAMGILSLVMAPATAAAMLVVPSLVKAESLTGLIAALKDARALFEHRNALIHGRIYEGGRPISNRSDVPDRRVSPDELLELAERIFTCKEHISMYRERHPLPC